MIQTLLCQIVYCKFVKILLLLSKISTWNWKTKILNAHISFLVNFSRQKLKGYDFGKNSTIASNIENIGVLSYTESSIWANVIKKSNCSILTLEILNIQALNSCFCEPGQARVILNYHSNHHKLTWNFRSRVISAFVIENIGVLSNA